ncbi:follicle-stimulating hormone receptor-like [Saccoglossus kowalevskii]|uniref:Lutropin-choriogonadotropic hormone receptor-like n=1 Tax=Saccoglossus kowalevskii TaxID=10224 RepID=A0ABM0GX23_SACKO|nr:PREDICTED: lutropin-choriogonadotropic hormone receptor-like [Saccoglossus kowalevskii]
MKPSIVLECCVLVIALIVAAATSTEMTTDLPGVTSPESSTGEPLHLPSADLIFDVCSNVSQLCSCTNGAKLNVRCRGVPVLDIQSLGIPTETQILTIIDGKGEILKADSFSGLTVLEHLKLTDWRGLIEIEAGAFDGLPNLWYLELLQLTSLLYIGPGVIADFPSLKDIWIHESGLRRVPDFSNFSTSESSIDIYLGHNSIEVLPPYSFFGVEVAIGKLSVISNNIYQVDESAFGGLTVVEIDLSYNPLTHLKPDAFSGTNELRTLKLSASEMTFLPTNGLKFIQNLYIEETYSFKIFPPVFEFQRIKKARLTYFTHCCAFSYPTEDNYINAEKYGISEDSRNISTCPPTPMTPVVTPTQKESSLSLFFSEMLSNTRKRRSNRPRRSDEAEWGETIPTPAPSDCDDPFDPLCSNPEIDILVPMSNRPTVKPPLTKSIWIPEILNPNESYIHIGDKCGELVPKDYSLVDCKPEANPFNPCGDVLNYIILKILIWFVSLTALLGNFIVLVVLLSYISKITVTKFLMCNLAFADFLQGVYLLVTGIVDVVARGQYYNYAIDWQWGAGCKSIGFISIFATCVSVFTLTTITMERWYAIIHAMHLNKRLHMKMAAKIMLVGWVFSLSMACLPLFGVSDYSVTSMCLPMDATGALDLVYILTLCTIITLAFLLVVGCYVKMYHTVRSPESCSLAHKKDATVAKRMGILVFTDFACVVPIMVFAFTAALAKPLIGVEEAKILLVIFYPINSCTNPFLYAICTKAFRRDLFMMLTKHGFCEKRAMKYKGTYSSGGRSMSHSVNQAPTGTSTCHRPSSSSLMTQCMVDWHYNGNEWHNSRSSLNSNCTPQTTPKGAPRNLHLIQTPEEDEDARLLSNGMAITLARGSVSSCGSSKSKESLSRKLSKVPERQESSSAEQPSETTKLNPCEEIWRKREALENAIAPIAEEEKITFDNEYENVETIEAIATASTHSSDSNNESETVKSQKGGLPLDKSEQIRKDSRTDSGIHSTITTPDVVDNIDTRHFPNTTSLQLQLLDSISDETRL